MSDTAEFSHEAQNPRAISAKVLTADSWEAFMGSNVEVTGGAPQARSPVDCRVGGADK